MSLRGIPIVKVSNATRVVYSEAGHAEQDVVDHYVRVVAVMLPHLLGRPLTRVRFIALCAPWAESRFEEAAHILATRLVQGHPDVFSTEFLKREGKGRVLVGWMRNSFGATNIAPYSLLRW